MRTGRNRGLRARGKVFCFTWAQGGVGYSLVGTISFSALQLIAKETRSQLDRSGPGAVLSRNIGSWNASLL